MNAPSRRLLLPFLVLSWAASAAAAPPRVAKTPERPAPAPSASADALAGLAFRSIGPGIMGGRIDDFAVVEASNGAEAWALIQQHKPGLVLLDVQMPGRSGLEVLRLIKADPSLKATRVILLTSKAQETDVEVGLMAGADFYLTKPFSPLDLLTRVEEALQI